jgi:ribonuclease HI
MTREALEREEAALRAKPSDFLPPTDVFNKAVGHFWDIWGTRPDTRARFAAANALLKVNTVPAVETALSHFEDMLRRSQTDNLGVRDIIPNLMLRLGREQDCYDFLKWWTLVPDNYSWGDMSLPYLDIHGADVFEPVDKLCNGTLSLSQLVALTLLKLRLYLDLEQLNDPYGERGPPNPELDRKVGKLIREAAYSMENDEIEETVSELREQYLTVLKAVDELNPHFWPELGDDDEDELVPSPSYTTGSPEEAMLALYHCKGAWVESEDAIIMAETDSCDIIKPNEVILTTSATTAFPRNAISKPLRLPIQHASGMNFPTKFQTSDPSRMPTEIFPPTTMGSGLALRFICRTNKEKVLVYVDGACTKNRQTEARPGWAVVFGPTGQALTRDDSSSSVVARRLERKGPFGDHSENTSNRAELRATVAALRLCDWARDGLNCLVVATDSSYVVDGATSWVRSWMQRNWKTSTKSPVQNKDLWDTLLGEVGRLAGSNVRVEFWKIPRELNIEADKAAKAAANKTRIDDCFRDDYLRPMPTSPEPSPSTLVLCLNEESLFGAVHEYLIQHLEPKVSMRRVSTQAAAIEALSAEVPPSIILAADGAITRNKKVRERVIDCLHRGATVVLCGCFSSTVTEGEFNRFFASLGLPWVRGGYERVTVTLKPDIVGQDLAVRLPSSYSTKAQFAAGVVNSATWYTSKEGWESRNQAAVAFINVGQGKLGYIGDVNGENESTVVVLAMCDLLD